MSCALPPFSQPMAACLQPTFTHIEPLRRPQLRCLTATNKLWLELGGHVIPLTNMLIVGQLQVSTLHLLQEQVAQSVPYELPISQGQVNPLVRDPHRSSEKASSKPSIPNTLRLVGPFLNLIMRFRPDSQCTTAGEVNVDHSHWRSSSDDWAIR